MIDYEKVKIIILDVDGTLTDGGILYDDHGNECKHFNVKDGLGIKVAIAAGIEVAILTGRDSSIVKRRADELGIHYLRMGIQQKFSAMMQLIRELDIRLDEVCYVGDDWNDLRCMSSVGIAMCPSDAAKEIIEICDFVSKFAGGYGAVRECIEVVLKQQGKWEQCCGTIYFK